MFDRSDLRAAVGANVLSADQASRLEAFLLSRKDDGVGNEQIGQENLRFLANFNDIFITLGLLILFIGVIAILAVAATPALVKGNVSTGVLAASAVAGLAWALLEYFCGRRRLLLPSMALTLLFTGFIALGVTAFVGSQRGITVEFDVFDAYRELGVLSVTNFVVSALAAALVFIRFKLPFALGEIAAMSSTAVYFSLAFFGDLGLLIGGWAAFAMGILTLAFAIWFDMKDPERIRKPSDYAFWLHLAAAPQIIFGVNTLVTGSNIFLFTATGADNTAQGVTLLFVLLIITVISLALNRRALIASSLLTFIVTLTFVLDRAGLDGFNIFAITTILIGTGVVLLGAGWKTARRAVLVIFPKGDTWGRVFPPEPA